MQIMISLVGAQPAPNVLPLAHFNPKKVIFVHTNMTEQIALRMAEVITQDYGIEVIQPLCSVNPYRITEIGEKLAAYVENNVTDRVKYIFNLTGGTKPMAIAAFEVAKSLSANVFYYQSQDNQDLIYPYFFDDAIVKSKEPETCQATLTLDRFLRLYIGGYTRENFKDEFELKVFNSLEKLGKDYEVFHNIRLQVSGDLEVDWILRYKNSIAIGEVKAQAGKDSIDQLNSACHPKNLGTYTKKFLISGRGPRDNRESFHHNHIDLMKAYNIHGMILRSYNDDELSIQDKEILIETIRTVMEKGRKG